LQPKRGSTPAPWSRAATPPGSRIVETAEELDAGLIVLGSHGRSGLGYVLLGSVATAVAQHSKRSVMIIHRDR
jgi:nucleotide-binding universal stress UspA family protein